MPLVNCLLHGDCDEAGSKVSFFAPAPVTLASLHKLFPFEGTFHFRLRVDGAMLLGLKGAAPGDPYYVWLDLTDAACAEFSSVLSAESVEVQALCVALPEGHVDDAQYLPHYDKVDEEFHQMASRSDRYPIVSTKKDKNKGNGSGGGGSGLVRHTTDVLKSISRGARDGLKQGVSMAKQQQQSLGASFMGFTKTVFNGLTKTADMSAIAEDNLAQLSDDASTAFSDKNSVHVSVLLNLWEVLFPQGGPYQRTSETWRTAGFQKADPITDLKATGILALRAMTYLCHKYPVKAQHMLKKNQANVKVRRCPAWKCVKRVEGPSQPDTPNSPPLLPTSRCAVAPPGIAPPPLHRLTSRHPPSAAHLRDRPTTRSPSLESTSPCSSSTSSRYGTKNTSRPLPNTGPHSKTTPRFSSFFAWLFCTWITCGGRKGPSVGTLGGS